MNKISLRSDYIDENKDVPKLPHSLINQKEYFTDEYVEWLEQIVIKKINYIPCCTELKDKEALTFGEWLRTKGYKTDFIGNWIKGQRTINGAEIVLREQEYRASL